MKRNACLIVVIICTLLLSACYPFSTLGPSIKTEETQETITLRFVNSWGGVDSNAQTLQQIFNDFMVENPDIIIQNEALGGGDFLKKLKADFATNNDPDVFGLWPGSDMNALIEAGKVADLTELMAENPEWYASFGDEAWSLCSVDDRIYGLPVEIIYEALFINTEIFDQYDAHAPETFEDLGILARLFSTKGIIPIAYNFEAEGTYLYQNLLAQIGGRDGVVNVSECYRDAMYRMKDLYNANAFPEDAYRISNNQRNALFLEGQAAMIVQGSWFTRQLYEQGMGHSVDIVPMPRMNEDGDGYTLVYGLGCGTFFMSQKAWDDPVKREAGIRLLRKLTSPEVSQQLTSGSGFISNIDMSSIAQEESTLYVKGQELIEGASDLAPPPDSIIDRDLWENEIVPGFSDVFDYGDDGIERLWGLISENKK